MKTRAVIFDFDGVINDSSAPKSGMKRIIEVVRRDGHEIPRDIYKRLGGSWGEHGGNLIEICFDLDPETAKIIYREWEKMDAIDLFPLVRGAKRVLEKLKFQGIKIFLLTNRNRKNLMTVLEHFGLVTLFDLIQAKDDFLFAKPDSRTFYPLLVELSKFGICRGERVFVGDTILDFKCATGAIVENVSVLTGAFNESDFLKAGQKRENIIPSVANLPEWIEKHCV
jgi:HAD superfamily hydrolase (TIGR01549 family)